MNAVAVVVVVDIAATMRRLGRAPSAALSVMFAPFTIQPS